MTTKQLIELAERCEAAAGLDRELDQAIADACGITDPNRAETVRFVEGVAVAYSKYLPFFTHSLDAVLTLKLEGCRRLDMSTGDKFMWAVIHADNGQFRGEADTLALALLAAILRAIAADREA